MKTLTIPEPKTASEALTQTRIFERAESLWSNGYDYKSAAELGFSNDLFLVYTAENRNGYIVDVKFQRCECECFQKLGYCKHYLAIEKMLQECEEAEYQQRLRDYE